MATTAELQVIITARETANKVLKELSAQLGSVDKQASMASKSAAGLHGAFSGITGVVGGVVKSLGAVGLAAMGINAVADAAKGLGGQFGVGLAAQTETVRAQFMAFTKSASETDKILAQVRAEADKTPFAFQEMATAAAMLLPASKTAEGGMMGLIHQAEILAALNPSEGLKGAAFSLREALSGDFVSVMERFNIPRELINRLKAEGVPNAQIVGRALKEMGADMDLVSNLANTTQGRLSTFNDALDGIRQTVGKPILAALGEQLDKMSVFLAENQVAIKAFAQNLGDFIAQGVRVAADAIGRLVEFFRPLGAVLADVGAAAVAMVHGDWANAMNGLQEASDKALAFLRTSFGSAGAAVAAVLVGLAKLIQGDMAGALANLGEAAARAGDFLRTTFGGAIARVQAAFSDFAPTGERIGELFATIGRIVSEKLAPLLGDLIGQFRDVTSAASNGETPMKNLASAVNAVSDKVEGFLKSGGDFLNLLGAIKDSVVIVTSKYGEWLVAQGLMNEATAKATKETQGTKASIDALWAILATTPVGKVVTAFQELVKQFQDAQAVNEGFASATGAAWAAIVGFAENVKKEVGDKFNELGAFIASLPARFEADAGATGLAILMGIVNALNPATLATAIIAMVTDAMGVGKATAAAGSPAIGQAIASGMAAGISNGIGWVTAAAGNLAAAAKAAANNALGISSPSKVFEEIGEYVDQGFIDGIEGMTSDVETAIGDLMTGAGEAATTAAVDAFANLATALGAQFEKTFTIVEAAQNAIDNARSDLDRKYQRDTELEETKFQRRLAGLRADAATGTVAQKKAANEAIEKLQEAHSNKLIDNEQSYLDRIAELEFDSADTMAKAVEKQALVAGAGIRDFKRDTDELLRDTTSKAIEIGKKASTAIALAMKESDKSIQEARDRADEAIQSLRDNQDLSRNLRSMRDTFSEGQDAESKTRDRKQEDADLEYNLTRDLEKAKLKLGKDRGKAETDQDRRQLDIQYADEVQNLRDGFNEAKRDLARRRAIADDNDAFRKGQQKALQAFNDNLEDEALAKQVKRLREERDTRVKELQAALDDKRTQINQSEADEREALAKSSAEKLDDLKTKFYDKVGALNEESKSAFESLFEGIAAGVKAAAGAVNDLSVAINRVATTKGAPTPASGGGGIAAGDGQTFGGQTPDVQQMFLSAYGSRAAAEEAWIVQHNYEIDLGNLGRPPKFAADGTQMTGPWNGEAGQSWFSTPEESGSNASDHFAGGGVVGGRRGAARLVTAHGGEGVFTPEQMAALGGVGGGGDIYLSLEIDGQRFAYAVAPYVQGETDRIVRLKLG